MPLSHQAKLVEYYSPYIAEALARFPLSITIDPYPRAMSTFLSQARMARKLLSRGWSSPLIDERIFALHGQDLDFIEHGTKVAIGPKSAFGDKSKPTIAKSDTDLQQELAFTGTLEQFLALCELLNTPCFSPTPLITVRLKTLLHPNYALPSFSNLLIMQDENDPTLYRVL